MRWLSPGPSTCLSLRSPHVPATVPRRADRTSRNRYACCCLPYLGRSWRCVDHQLPDSAEGYHWRRQSRCTSIDSVPAGTSYVDSTNVASSNTYSYRIKARNAQGLSAQSAFRNVTTSAAPLTPINHAVDAVAVAWTFDLPEPTVTHTPRVPVGHAVDAAAVAWVFDLPEPSVTSAVAFSVELTLTQTATENVYTWTNPDSYILDFVCADDNPIGPLSGYSSVRSSIPASLLTLSYTRPAGAPYYALRLVSTDQFSNTVGPADNVASGDYAVGAGAVAWVYDLPQPTVTHTPRVTVDHAVDAGGCGLGLRPS